VFFLPSVFYLALGKELLCRVPEKKHSANHMALGKEPDSGSETTAASTTRGQMPGRWLEGPPPSPVQLAAAGCGAHPRATHDNLTPTSTQFIVAGAKLARVQPAMAKIELHMPTRIQSPNQREDVALKLHVASVLLNYFKCFSGML
jgi:hypothetical protein